MTNITCLSCNKSFLARGGAKTCSSRCRKKLQRTRVSILSEAGYISGNTPVQEVVYPQSQSTEISPPQAPLTPEPEEKKPEHRWRYALTAVFLLFLGSAVVFGGLSNFGNNGSLQDQQQQLSSVNELKVKLNDSIDSLELRVAEIESGLENIPVVGGSQGSNGADGVDGTDGADGVAGPAGATGATGAAGATGATGPAGVGTCANGDCLSLQVASPGVAEVGNTNITGTAIAGLFSGSGASLTSLNGSNVSSGTVADARLSTNVTLQGNTFNGASQLVQLTAGGILPVLDGSNLTNITGANVTGNISGNAGTATALAANPTDCAANTYATTIAANGNLTCASITDASLSANVTLQGNTFNGASQLVQLTAGGILPVLDGSNLTTLNATNLSSGTVASGRISGSYTGIAGTGALNAGSITSGFGAIDTGVDNITTTGTVGGGIVGINTSTFGTNNKLIVNPYNTVDNLATVQINANAATNKGLVVQGFASQSANMQEWQSSAGTALSAISSTGALLFPTGSVSTPGLQFTTVPSGGRTGIYGPSSAESLQFAVRGATPLTLNGGTAIAAAVALTNAHPSNNAIILQVTNTAATQIGQIIKGAASQTADLQQWQDSTSAVKNQIFSDGRQRIHLNATSASGLEIYNDNDSTSLVQIGSGGAKYQPRIALVNGISGVTVSLLTTGASGSEQLDLNGAGIAFGSTGRNLTIGDVSNIVLSTGTGTKIGTATTQKLGFYNATPVVQPAGTTDVLASLVTLGLRGASSNPPLDLGSGTITSGLINSQNVSSAANFTGTLAVNGASVTVGTASTTNGTLVLQNSTNAFTTTITAPNTAGSSKTITLPNETGTVCTTGSVCSGYAASASAFIQNGNSFGTTATLGTNDANSLVFETNNQVQVTIADGGVTTFKNSTNSTTAFQVQNTTSTSVLSVDTVNSKLTLQSADPLTLGSELFTDIADCSGPNWTVGVSDATHTPGIYDELDCSTPSVSANTTYQVSFDITGNSDPSDPIAVVVAFIGGAYHQEELATNTTHTFLITTYTTANLGFGANDNFDGTISNISVKEVTTLTDRPVFAIKHANGSAALEVRTSVIYLNNLFVGQNSGLANTTGFSNTAIGLNALQTNIAGFSNTAIGLNALQANDYGYSNTAIGSNALYFNTDGYSNTAIGSNALYSNTEGRENTALGDGALYFNTEGDENTAIGSYALYSNTYGDGNTAFGESALRYNTTGSDNTAIGTNALQSNIAGEGNIAIGSNALTDYYGAGGNIAIGYNTLLTNTSGVNNIAIGYGAGLTAAGSNNIFIGGLAGSLEAGDDKLYIENSNSSTPLIYGDFSTDSLTINGTVMLPVLTQVSGGTLTDICLNSSDEVVETSGNTCSVSSARFKKNIETLSPGVGLDILGQLRTVSYEYNDGDIPHYGFIAEDIDLIDPTLVVYDDQGLPFSLDFNGIIAVLTQATQDISVEVQDISARLAVIEAGNFSGNLQVSGSTRIDENLSVVGNTTLASLKVLGGTEVANITVSGKIITAGDTPTVVLGATTTGNGSSYSIEGNDTAGSVTISTGTSTGAGEQAVLTFVTPFDSAPRIALTPKNANSSAMRYYVETTATGFSIHFLDTPTQSTAYIFDYIVLQ